MGQLQNLEDTIVATATVKVSERGGFEVRGLSPYDATAILMRHRGHVSALFESFAAKVNGGETIGLGDGASMVMGAVESAPDLVAEIIALASGADPVEDPEDFVREVAVARKLSLGVQADALEKIAGLTFTSEMPAGKFLSLALGAMQSATAGLNKNLSPEQ